jgi:hypothetical protein
MFRPFFIWPSSEVFIVIANSYTLYMSVTMSFRQYYKDVYQLKCILKQIIYLFIEVKLLWARFRLGALRNCVTEVT